MTSTTSGIAPATFPHEELTRIDGAPTYLTLHNLKREILANAISVHSTRGSGNLGHAVIVLGDAEYNRVANLPGGGNANDWTPIAHPGAQPNYPANAAANQIARIQGQFERDLKEFIIFQNTANALKQQCLAAVDNTYICSLQDPMYGYAQVTVFQILEHLNNTYGALEELGWPQGPTPIKTDNAVADGIANDTVKQHHSKAMDMRFYWIRDRVKQGHFLVYWSKGIYNRADYFTKHHPASHHRVMRPVYLHVPASASTATALSLVRGCVDLPVPGQGIHD